MSVKAGKLAKLLATRNYQQHQQYQYDRRNKQHRRVLAAFINNSMRYNPELVWVCLTVNMTVFTPSEINMLDCKTKPSAVNISKNLPTVTPRLSSTPAKVMLEVTRRMTRRSLISPTVG